jgi:hypothetical protein
LNPPIGAVPALQTQPSWWTTLSCQTSRVAFDDAVLANQDRMHASKEGRISARNPLSWSSAGPGRRGGGVTRVTLGDDL